MRGKPPKPCERCGEVFHPPPRSITKYCGRLKDRSSCKWKAKLAADVASDKRRRDAWRAERDADIADLKRRIG